MYGIKKNSKIGLWNSLCFCLHIAVLFKRLQSILRPRCRLMVNFVFFVTSYFVVLCIHLHHQRSTLEISKHVLKASIILLGKEYILKCSKRNLNTTLKPWLKVWTPRRWQKSGYSALFIVRNFLQSYNSTRTIHTQSSQDWMASCFWLENIFKMVQFYWLVPNYGVT